MNTNENNENNIKTVLKEAYTEIQPADSWEALRARIDDRINDKDMSPGSDECLTGVAAFWRRIALALAACLILTSALLIYAIYKPSENQQQTRQRLLSREQVEQLNAVFSNIRTLFGTQQPWMVVDAGGKGEIGVDNPSAEDAQAGKVIIIRLAVNTQDGQRYYDVVALSNQQVSFSIPEADGSDMNVTLKPVLANNGRIAVEINARLGGGPQSGGTVTIADNRFTSLVRVKSDSKWVNIDAAGQSANI